MSGLLDEVLTAHGGLERWRAVTALTAHGRFGGLLRSRFPGNRMANVRIETRDGELIDARRNARAAFDGLSGVRRNLRWDALDAAYFAGYAWWNYLSTPMLLTREGVTVAEGETWPEAGEQWRRLEVKFPPDMHTHSQRQTFYVDAAGLIRRHDYVAEPIGRWARAAHYCDDHRQFGGLAFPTRRRVRPRGTGGRSLPKPILVALDIDQIEIET
jgi:hypothetical protein